MNSHHIVIALAFSLPGIGLAIPLPEQVPPPATSEGLLSPDPAEFARSVIQRGGFGASEAFTNARLALEAGELDKAEAWYQRGALASPEAELQAMLGLAEVERLRKSPDRSAYWLSKAYATNPQNTMVARAWARFQHATGQFSKAEQILLKAAEATPAHAGLQIDLAENYLRGMRQPELALRAYQRAASLQPNHAGAQLGIASALVELGRNDEAAQAFLLAQELEQTSPLPPHRYGRFLASLGRTQEAIAALTEALRRNGRYVPGLLDRADLHFATGSYESALSDYRAVSAVLPQLAIANFKAGMVEQVRGNYDAAEKEYLSAVANDPGMFGAYNNLAWIRAEQRRGLDEALDYARTAISLSPGAPRLYDTLAWVHRARGELDQAIDAATRAASGAPDNPEHHLHLGIILAESGRTGAAVAAFQRVVSAAPDTAFAKTAKEWLQRLGS